MKKSAKHLSRFINSSARNRQPSISTQKAKLCKINPSRSRCAVLTGGTSKFFGFGRFWRYQRFDCSPWSAREPRLVLSHLRLLST